MPTEPREAHSSAAPDSRLLSQRRGSGEAVVCLGYRTRSEAALPLPCIPLPAKEAEIDLASARADPVVAELLGRNDELAQLYDLIDGIGQRGGALVVRGEAGIGKSALLEA